MRHNQSGFTIIELLAVVGILSLMLLVAAPNIVDFKGQLASSEDVRTIAHSLAQLRAEAMRLRTNIRVSFTSDSMTWDVYDDGTDDGSLDLNASSNWIGGSVPSDIVFNGLGLARGIAVSKTIGVNNRGHVISLTVNKNGHIAI